MSKKSSALDPRATDLAKRNEVTKDTHKIYEAYKKAKNGTGGGTRRGRGRKAATEEVARLFKLPIPTVREAVLREQATAEGVDYWKKLHEFEKNREYSTVKFEIQRHGGVLNLQGTWSNSVMTMEYTNWLVENISRHVQAKGDDAGVLFPNPVTGKKFANPVEAWTTYQEALVDCIIDAIEDAVTETRPVTEKDVQKKVKEHPLSNPKVETRELTMERIDGEKYPVWHTEVHVEHRPFINLGGMGIEDIPGVVWFNKMSWVRTEGLHQQGASN